jgi:hypothetical protein
VLPPPIIGLLSSTLHMRGRHGRELPSCICGRYSAIRIDIPLIPLTPLSRISLILNFSPQTKLDSESPNSKMAPASSRSSSISSSSSTKSKYSEVKKKFCCSFPQCGKSFSRSEHLHRHALNHKDGNNTCLRCSAHFRRRDLLGESHKG